MVLRDGGVHTNGTLVYVDDPTTSTKHFYVFTSVHFVVDEAKGADHRVELKMLDEQGSEISLVWTKCVHSGAAYWGAKTAIDKLSNDCAVFVLSTPPQSVQMRAISLFNWGNGHKPSSKAVGVSLIKILEGTVQEVRLEERLSIWAAGPYPGYVMIPRAISVGESGTGITDKKQRLIGVISGNINLQGRDMIGATLAPRFLALLRAPVETFACTPTP
jgi:hypothetical protein